MYDHNMNAKKGKKGKGMACNMTDSMKSSTMPQSNKSFNNYGLSSKKITKRSAK